MYYNHAWTTGVHYLEIAKRMGKVISDLGWQSRWNCGGVPSLNLRISSHAKLRAWPAEKPPLGLSKEIFVTPESLPDYSSFVHDPDIFWSFTFSCFPAGYASLLKAPLSITASVSGSAVVRPAGWDDYLTDSSGIVRFLLGGVGVDLDYQHINERTLPFYLKAYLLTKELWHILGADSCYGQHEKVGIARWENSEASRQFQFSYSEPVRLLQPLEEGRLPTSEEIASSSIIHPGLWGLAKGRIDLQPGEWNWKPQGLASLEFPKSKDEWERRSFPTPWNKSP